MSSRRLLPALALLAIAASAALLLSGRLTSQAVQNPTISLDMVTSGNTYDENTNSMAVGAIDSCLTSPNANPATHNHVSQLIVQNVEDLVAFQVRLNYIGDKMRPVVFNPTPFTDTLNGGNVGFVNLPLDAGVHRTVFPPPPGIPLEPPPPDGSNTPLSALVGSAYQGTQTFPVSPDTPTKATPDDTSYNAPTGGVLGALTLQVVGDESGNQLFMNLDDAFPNAPGSRAVVFTGSGTSDINLASSAMGDGFHGEGVTCVPQDCTSQECPPVSPTPTVSPSPTLTPFPTPTGTCCTISPSPTATATATRTATPTPTPCSGCTPTSTPTATPPTPTPPASATVTATVTATPTTGGGTPPPPVTFTNNTGNLASDLHIKVNQIQAGHSIQLVSNAPGCPSPTITVDRTQDVDFEYFDKVDWATPCVDPGESASFAISCSPSCTAQVTCHHWTVFATPIGNPCLPSRTTTPSATASPTAAATPSTPTPTVTPTYTASPTPTSVATPATPTPTPPAPTGTPTGTPTSGPTPQPQDIYIVNSTGDGPDAARGDGRCETATPGECTLRAAIEDSSTLRRFTPDVIKFNIGGGGAQTISPQAPLPALDDRVIIDGTTQPGYSGTPLIQVAGGGAGTGANGLRFTNGGNTVKGLDIRLFGGDGIRIEAFTSGTVITQSNILGNSGHGIYVNSSSNQIGGTSGSAGNQIANNGGDGIFVASGLYSSIRGNSIYNNSGLGIDLAPDGVTPNDSGDADTGANNLQNFPVISFASKSDSFPSVLQIGGTLNSTRNTTFTLEFFKDTASCNPALIEGRTFVGSATTTANSNGDASWFAEFSDPSFDAESVTVTATDPSGDTSEFSSCSPVSIFSPTPSPTPSPTVCAGCTPTSTATSTPTPGPLTPTPTPTPTPNISGHDARVVRISNVPKSVRLLPGEIVGDSGNVVIANQSTHSETIGVYVDVMAPSAGGCTPNGRAMTTTVTLSAGAKTTVSVPVGYSCSDPAVANGLSYTWVAVADHGGDDLASCPPGSLQGLACFNALADDDDDSSDNRVSRNGPKVVAQ